MARRFEVATTVERGMKGRVHWAWIDGDQWKDYTRKLYAIDLLASGQGSGVVVVDPIVSILLYPHIFSQTLQEVLIFEMSTELVILEQGYDRIAHARLARRQRIVVDSHRSLDW